MTLIIGMTYDLRDDYLAQGYTQEEASECDKLETIEGIENGIAAMGHRPVRIGNLSSLMKELLAGERWDLVFNIAEGFHGMSREAQVPALLEAFRIPYTHSDPVVLGYTHQKAMTKRIVRSFGLNTADFFVVETLDDVKRVDMTYPLFAKPLAEGTGKGISELSRVADRSGLEKACRQILETCRQPVLVERFLPGREFTVGVMGTGAAARPIGVMEVVFNDGKSGIYSYHTKANYEELVSYRLVGDDLGKACADLAVAGHRALGCRDVSRVDIRQDDNGRPCFIEVNALPGLNPPHSDLPILGRLAGVDYNSLIAGIVESALERYPGLRPS
jgi:D-alanine-D-alanine ligase